VTVLAKLVPKRGSKAMIDVLSDLFILRGVLVEIFGLFPGAR
jgi:hypothetical protein